MIVITLYDSETKDFQEICRVNSEDLAKHLIARFDKACESGSILKKDGKPFELALGIDSENGKLMFSRNAVELMGMQIA